jgi:hypothetical protein
MSATCDVHGDRRNAYKILVGNLEGKIILGKPRRNLEDNIKTNFRNTVLEGVDWINMSRDRAGFGGLRILQFLG